MFFPSKAESLGDVIENSQKHSYAFGVFWPALWFAIVITFVAGLVDTSNRISNPTGRAIAFFSGVIIFLCAAYKIISLGSKRKKL